MGVFLHRFLAAICVAFLLSGCGGHDDDVPLVLSTMLNAEEQIPSNATSALASGTVTFDWDSNLLIATVFSPELTPTEVHLHNAPGDLTGLVVTPLARVGATEVWQGSATLTDPQRAALQRGNFYFDLHTATFPGDQLRGQLFGAFPPHEHVAALLQTASQSALIEEQLRQLDDYEDWWHGGHSGVGLGLTFGF